MAPRSEAGRGAFCLLASVTVVGLAGSSLPTPLYPLYQAAWGFSAITVTGVFAVYALAVLVALLVAGRLSDHLGRRPVLLASTLVQAVAMLAMACAHGVAALAAGRVLQGLATGAAMAAVGAGMVDIDRARGTTANAIAPILGTASGALGAGLTVHYLPAPTQLAYGLLGLVFLLQCLGLWHMAEPVSRRPGALASLRPRLAVPAALRVRLLLALPVLVASWALSGFYASLGPALVRGVFGRDASLYGGLALFLLAGGGTVAVALLQQRPARTVVRLGAVGLLAGVGLVLVAIALRSLPAFLLGTVLAGMGFGAGFQGAMRSVLPLAAARERAGVLAVAFVAGYLAMGLPAVAAGVLVARGLGIVTAAYGFGAAVMLLAALAWAGDVWAARRPSLNPPAPAGT